MVHSFETSKNLDDDPRWGDLYRSALPYYVSHDVVTAEKDLATQYKGIDHYVHQDGFPDLTVDVKARSKWYNDCLLEIISNDQTGRWGWFLTAKCDLVVSACLNERRGWLVPLARLRFHITGQERIRPDRDFDFTPLLEDWDVKVAKNQDYNTKSIILPRSVVEEVGGKWLSW